MKACALNGEPITDDDWEANSCMKLYKNKQGTRQNKLTYANLINKRLIHEPNTKVASVKWFISHELLIATNSCQLSTATKQRTKTHQVSPHTEVNCEWRDSISLSLVIPEFGLRFGCHWVIDCQCSNTSINNAVNSKWNVATQCWAQIPCRILTCFYPSLTLQWISLTENSLANPFSMATSNYKIISCTWIGENMFGTHEDMACAYISIGFIQ